MWRSSGGCESDACGLMIVGWFTTGSQPKFEAANCQVTYSELGANLLTSKWSGYDQWYQATGSQPKWQTQSFVEALVATYGKNSDPQKPRLFHWGVSFRSWPIAIVYLWAMAWWTRAVDRSYTRLHSPKIGAVVGQGLSKYLITSINFLVPNGCGNGNINKTSTTDIRSRSKCSNRKCSIQWMH